MILRSTSPQSFLNFVPSYSYSQAAPAIDSLNDTLVSLCCPWKFKLFDNPHSMISGNRLLSSFQDKDSRVCALLIWLKSALQPVRYIRTERRRREKGRDQDRRAEENASGWRMVDDGDMVDRMRKGFGSIVSNRKVMVLETAWSRNCKVTADDYVGRCLRATPVDKLTTQNIFNFPT